MKAKKTKAKKKSQTMLEKGPTFDEKFRDRYTVDRSVRTPSGGFSVSNQDDVAKALNGLSLDQLAKIAARAGMAERWARWSHLNPGMQRMNLGNCLRALTTDHKRVALAEGAKMPRTGQAKGRDVPAHKPTKSKTKRGAKVAAPVAVPESSGPATV